MVKPGTSRADRFGPLKLTARELFVVAYVADFFATTLRWPTLADLDVTGTGRRYAYGEEIRRLRRLGIVTVASGGRGGRVVMLPRLADRLGVIVRPVADEYLRDVSGDEGGAA